MQKILIAGAGKTSVYLIDYLLANAAKNSWKVLVADTDIEAVKSKISNNTHAEAHELNITDDKKRASLVEQVDIVISLMPPHLHTLLAQDCIRHKKHLITSSYVSDQMKAFDQQAKDAGVMFMCEMGLDPGIDHMTAHEMIYDIHKVAGTITSFKSYTGGLIAPESDDNPWHYKFSWNPRNVVLAGNAGAQYLQNGKIVTVPYENIFAQAKKLGKINGVGPLAYYPNRDSLTYLEKYNLNDVKTFIRATLRYPIFNQGWDALVQLGLTNPEDKVKPATYAQWIADKNRFDAQKPLKGQIAKKLGIESSGDIMNMLDWLGILSEEKIKPAKNNSADILLDILLKRWEMKPDDKDMIVMLHEIEYQHRNNSKTTVTSSMVINGEGGTRSAMAKTVGLPMAILAKLILTNKVTPPAGVHIPIIPSVYKPVLAELKENGIFFTETIS